MGYSVLRFFRSVKAIDQRAKKPVSKIVEKKDAWVLRIS